MLLSKQYKGEDNSKSIYFSSWGLKNNLSIVTLIANLQSCFWKEFFLLHQCFFFQKFPVASRRRCHYRANQFLDSSPHRSHYETPQQTDSFAAVKNCHTASNRLGEPSYLWSALSFCWPYNSTYYSCLIFTSLKSVSFQLWGICCSGWAAPWAISIVSFSKNRGKDFVLHWLKPESNEEGKN